MHEILMVRVCYYEKGCEVFPERLLSREKALWWFEESGITPQAAIMTREDGLGVMVCEAFKFEFEFVPNLDEFMHFPNSNLYGEYDCRGVDVFRPALDAFVEISRRHMSHSTDIGLHFYGLFHVEVDEFRDEDGGLDDVRVYPTFLGELDFDKLPLALVEKMEVNCAEEA